MNLKYNYHTHTYRCGHALGEDEDYVNCAIKAGIKELGFSDHAPFNGISQPRVRMDFSQLDEYISSINKLKEKYKDQIKIYVGLEAEYFHEINDYYKELLTKLDYLICGQHYALDNSGQPSYVGFKKDDKIMAKGYVDRVVEAIESGFFKYIAHPDIILNSYTIRDDFIKEQCLRIIDAAERCHVPLEINLEGMNRKVRNGAPLDDIFYPYLYFWKLLEGRDVDVILGIDAHYPEAFLQDYDKYGEEIIKMFKLHKINRINIVD